MGKQRRGAAVSAMLVGAAVFGVACGGDPAADAEATPLASSAPAVASAPAGPPDAALPPVTFTDRPCPDPTVPGQPQLQLDDRFTCGVLTVPENRSTATGRTVRLTVARLASTAAQPRPDPVVFLSGGPGESAIAYAASSAGRIAADRDVIFVDQRGTLHADPFLNCPEIERSVRDAMALPSASPETAAGRSAATGACRDRLAAEGHDLGAYTTTENAADIADLRVAMGIPEWNVYAMSYGGELAMTLLRDHPAGIRSVVLDSPTALGLNVVEHAWPSAVSGYRALFDACSAQSACASAYPDLETEFFDTVRRLDREPQTVNLPDRFGGGAVLVDGGKLLSLAVNASYVPGSYAKVPAALHLVSAGDLRPAVEAIASIAPPGLFGHGLLLGVSCGEWAPRAPRDELLAAAGVALPAVPPALLAAPTDTWSQDCAAWDPTSDQPAQDPAPTSAPADVPVLVLSGGLDAVTPPAFARAAVGAQPRAEVVAFPGTGHGVLFWDTCAPTVLRDFFERPFDTRDTACAGENPAPPFLVLPG